MDRLEVKLKHVQHISNTTSSILKRRNVVSVINRYYTVFIRNAHNAVSMKIPNSKENA